MGIRALPFLLLAMAMVTGACGNKPSKDECAQLFAHVIDLEIKAGGGDSGDLTPEMKDDLERKRKAFIDTSSEKFIATCTSQTPKQVVKCQSEARTIDDFKKCE